MSEKRRLSSEAVQRRTKIDLAETAGTLPVVRMENFDAAKHRDEERGPREHGLRLFVAVVGVVAIGGVAVFVIGAIGG